MLGLLYKEFYLNRKYLYLIWGMSIFLSITTIALTNILYTTETAQMQFCLYSCLIMFAAISIMDYSTKGDANRLWASFAISIPQGAIGQIKSKYYFLAIVMVITLELFNIFEIIRQVCCGVQVANSSTQMILSLFVWFTLLMKAFEFPFVVRFGLKAGSNIRATILIGLFFGAIIYGLFGDLSMFGSIDQLFDFFLDVMNGKKGAETLLWLSGSFPCIIGALYFISYKISCKLYIKGVEHLDE